MILYYYVNHFYLQTFVASVKSRLVFTLLVLAHSGSPGKRTMKWVCVCVAAAIFSEQPQLLTVAWVLNPSANTAGNNSVSFNNNGQ